MAEQLNALFIMDNAVDDSVTTFADGNANILASLPAGNIQLPQHTKVVRTSNTGSMVVNISWGGATKRVSGAALMRHNLSAAATWRIQLYDTQNQGGSVLYDSTSLTALPTNDVDDENWGSDPTTTSVFQDWDNSDKFSTVYFTMVNALSAKLTLVDAGNTDGYLQVGRLFLGVTASPTINVGFGETSGWKEATKQFRTEGGTLRSDSKPQFREFALTMNELTHGERSGFSELIKKVGMRKDFFVDVFPEEGGGQERDATMVCKFTTLPKFIYSKHNTHNVTFNIAEA